MRKIDIENWERKEIYNHYRTYYQPKYMMTFQVDVTMFYDRVKKEKRSFYLSFIHFIMDILNHHPAFKYRIIDDGVYLFDAIHPSFTDLVEDTDQFRIISIDYDKDYQTFLKSIEEKRMKQGRKFIDLEDEKRADLVYITTFPWASYTAATHPETFDQTDAIPRVSWGKWQVLDNRKIMPLSIEVHHSFVDGYHLGQLLIEINEMLSKE